MPIVLIDVRKRYSTEQEIVLMSAVGSALQKTFEILNHDINVRLLVHEPHRFSTSPLTEPNPELCTLVNIDCYIGRSLDTKRALYRSIVENLEIFGIPKSHVKILLRETSQSNLGIRGGQAGCDVDVGYAIDI